MLRQGRSGQRDKGSGREENEWGACDLGGGLERRGNGADEYRDRIAVAVVE